MPWGWGSSSVAECFLIIAETLDSIYTTAGKMQVKMRSKGLFNTMLVKCELIQALCRTVQRFP
jgi:hypothetical protein